MRPTLGTHSEVGWAAPGAAKPGRRVRNPRQSGRLLGRLPLPPPSGIPRGGTTGGGLVVPASIRIPLDRISLARSPLWQKDHAGSSSCRPPEHTSDLLTGDPVAGIGRAPVNDAEHTFFPARRRCSRLAHGAAAFGPGPASVGRNRASCRPYNLPAGLPGVIGTFVSARRAVRR
ncbi:hypothetical protein FRAHR75_130071 [Frankia sp. Hr75.2]|nr:hypothetical protein FRAHR75_130071 [Frankia sp. Hr75.2]